MVAPSSNALQGFFLLLPLAYPSPRTGTGASTTRTATQLNSEWSYADSQGWSSRYPQCGGNRQSPINLNSGSTYFLPLRPIKFSNYDIPLPRNLTLSNTGHTVELDVPATINGERPYISGGIMQGKYEAVGVHFHWGSNGNKGSEHVIDNRRFDAEMHIVHRNVKYSTVAEATKHADGVAVLGIMFKITRNIDRYYPGLNKIFNKLPSLVKYRSKTAVNGELSLGQLLGDLNTKNFFTYSGSLTTPGCAEVVTWHVFANPLPIAYEQIRKFWSILNSQGGLSVNNFRPIQRRNGRTVFYRTTLANAIQPIHFINL